MRAIRSGFFLHVLGVPRGVAFFCGVASLCAGVFLAAAPPPSTVYGFTPRSSAAERRLEYRFLTIPSPTKVREAHAWLTAEPHVAGSPRDRSLAEWVRDRWREYGLEQVEIVEHEVLLPYATEVTVERPGWRASLKEDPVDGDPFSARDVGVAYHAYSASGDVTVPVVYAN